MKYYFKSVSTRDGIFIYNCNLGDIATKAGTHAREDNIAPTQAAVKPVYRTKYKIKEVNKQKSASPRPEWKQD